MNGGRTGRERGANGARTGGERSANGAARFQFYSVAHPPALTHCARTNARVPRPFQQTPRHGCQQLYLREEDSRLPAEYFILLLMSDGEVNAPHEISVPAMCARLMAGNPPPGLRARVMHRRLCCSQLFLHQDVTINNLQRHFVLGKGAIVYSYAKTLGNAITNGRAVRVIKTTVENVNGA